MASTLQIGTDKIDFDAIIKEEHDFNAAATEHPVEQGIAVVDHLKVSARTISIEAVITNTPVTAATFGMGGSFAEPSTVLQFSAVFDRVQAIVDRLRAAQDASEISVWTGKHGRVENVLVASFRAPYTNQDGIVFPLSLTQLRTVDVRQVAIPEVLLDRQKKKGKKGKRPTKPADRGSMAAKALGYGKSVL